MRHIEKNTDAASSLIGWLIDKPELLMDVTIHADQIDNWYLKETFKAIKELEASSTPIDLISVHDQMTKKGIDINFAYLAERVKDRHAGSITSGIGHLEDAIRSANACKVGMDAAAIINEAASRGDVQAMQSAVDMIINLGAEAKNYDFSFSEMFDLTIQDAADHLEGKVTNKISTGIKPLDEQIGGFHNGDLIILAARPAMGKTALMINMALGAGVGKRVGLMSGEQPKVQIGYRALAIQSGVAIGDIRKQMTDDQYEALSAASRTLSTNGGRIYEKPAPTIQDVCSKAREWKHKFNIDAIYIDYLQRIKPLKTNIPKHEQVAEIAMTLKELARTLDIPIIALAQVNRTVEQRPDKRPNTSDIKDSGVVEQEADQIVTLYRDEVYDENTDDRGVAELDVKKNRHGATGCVDVEWVASCLKFKGFGEVHTPFVFEQDQGQGDDEYDDGLWDKKCN